MVLPPKTIYIKWRLLTISSLAFLESYFFLFPNGWPLWALKETASSICIPLSILVLKSLDTGVLPSSWKRGHVTPVHKKGCRKNPNNYHPITLTSVVGKILESIIRDHILNRLTRHKLLYLSSMDMSLVGLVFHTAHYCYTQAYQSIMQTLFTSTL